MLSSVVRRRPIPIPLVLLAILFAALFGLGLLGRDGAALEGVTLKLVGSDYSPEATETVIDVEGDTGADVIVALGDVVDKDTVVIVVPGAPADFEVEASNVAIATDVDFAALSGTVDILGGTGLSFLVALSWDDETTSDVEFALGVNIQDFSLSTLNPDWVLPDGADPGVEDATIGFATADLDLGDTAGIGDFFPDGFANNGSSIDEGFTIQATLLVSSVLGDDATEGIFGTTDQEVTLRAHFNSTLALFDQEGATPPDPAPTDTSVEFSASISLTNPIGTSGYISAIGDWTLSLSIDNSAGGTDFEVAGSGSLLVADAVIDGGIQLDLAFSVAYAGGETTVTIEASTAETIEDIFDTSLDIDSLSLAIVFSTGAGGTAGTVTFNGEVSIGTATAAVSLDIAMADGAVETVDFEFAVTGVNIGAVATWLAGELGIDPGTIPDELNSLTLDSASLRVSLDYTTTPKKTEVAATAQVTYNALQANLLFYYLNNPHQPATTGLTLAIHLQPAGGEALTLSDVVPGITGDFGDMPVPDVAIGISTVARPWNGDTLAPEFVEFFSPIYGCDVAPDDCAGAQLRLGLPQGAFLTSSFTTPDSLDSQLESLWVDPNSPVILRGKVGLFGAPFQVSLEAVLPAMTPGPGEGAEWFVSGQLSFAIAFEGGEFSASILGDMTVNLPVVAEPVYGNPDHYRPGTFRVGAEVAVSGTGASITLFGALVPAPGQTAAWDTPFGVEWLSINGLAIQLGLEVGPTGVRISLGFAGDLRVGTKDIAGAIEISLTPMATLPYVIMNLEGIRFATLAGVEFQDVIVFYNDIATVIGTPAITLPAGWEDFNVALKDIEVSYAVKNSPVLCLFEGLRIRGDLYFGSPASYVPEAQPRCIPGDPNALPTFDPDGGCLIEVNATNGCFVGLDLEITPGTGLFASATLGALVLGPLDFEGALFELRAGPAVGVGFKLKGGLDIDPVLSGDIELEITPGGLHFLSNLTLFDTLFRAAVQADASFNLSNPSFAVEGEVQSTLGDQMAPAIRPVAQVLGGTITFINGAIQLLRDPNTTTGDVFVEFGNIVTQLNAQGYQDPVIADLGEFLVAVGDAQNTAAALGYTISLDQAINAVLQGGTIVLTTGVPGTVVNVCVGYEDDFGTCWGFRIDDCVIFGDPPNCWTIPPLSITIPGLCSLIPALPCTFAEIKAIIIDTLEDGFTAITGITVDDLTNTLQEIADGFIARPVLFDVACAKFAFDIGGSLTAPGSLFLQFHLIVLGQDVYLPAIAWDFAADPGTQAVALFGQFADALLNGGAEPFTCPLLGSAADTGFDTPPSNLQLTAPTTVNEGGSISLSGTFDAGTAQAGDIQTVTITWPDGAVETQTLAVGTTSFSASRTIADDNPSNTTSDPGTITVLVENSRLGSTSANKSLTIHNVAPTSQTLSVTPNPVNEGSSVTLSGTLADVGTLDSHVVTINWNDGSTQTLNLVAGVLSYSASHQYVDGPKSGNVSVTIKDDDKGSVAASAAYQVSNVPPTITAGSIKLERVVLDSAGNASVVESDVSAIDEGSILRLSGTFTDPGAVDTHELVVNWGDGVSEAIGVSGLNFNRSFSVLHVYRDDNPTGTTSDTATIGFRIRDKDGGLSATESRSMTVRDVAPTVSASLQDSRINENDTAVVDVTIGDAGPDDTFTLVIDWKDGTTETFPVPSVSSAGSVVEGGVQVRKLQLSHQYLDDNPTATPSDSYTIAISVTDDDTLSDATPAGLTVDNTAPRIASTSPQGTVQYSDPLNSPLVVTFDDVAADTMTLLGTTFSVDGGLPNAGLPGNLAISFDGCAATTVAGLPDPRTACTWSIDGIVHVAPGQYVFAVTVGDDDTGVTTAFLYLLVEPEDAYATYTGPSVFSSPASTNSGYGDVELRATVRDISVVPGIVPADVHAGDITHATVTFVDVLTGETLCTAQVTRIFAADSTTGGAACVAHIQLAAGQSSRTLNVEAVVGGWYTNELQPAALRQGPLVVKKSGGPQPEHLTGGIHFSPSTAAGWQAPANGQAIQGDVTARFKAPGKATIEGEVRFRFTAGGRSYEVVASNFDSLGILPGATKQTGFAEVMATATLVDKTGGGQGTVVASGLRLQLRVSDGSTDNVSFALWQANGLLVASSGWDGVTVLPPVAVTSGDAQVNY